MANAAPVRCCVRASGFVTLLAFGIRISSFSTAMKPRLLPVDRVRRILQAAARTRVLVIGDVMLDQFIWGRVSRISPEAPVPVVEFERESFMPGGAANVARNLTALQTPAELLGIVGRDLPARQLKRLLNEHRIGCGGLLGNAARPTSVKTRIVAHKQ